MPKSISRWWQLKYFLFSPRKLGKIPILTNIFQMGCNHQTDLNLSKICVSLFVLPVNFSIIPDNHGSVENYLKWKEINIGDTPIFHWTMIMGERVVVTVVSHVASFRRRHRGSSEANIPRPPGTPPIIRCGELSVRKVWRNSTGCWTKNRGGPPKWMVKIMEKIPWS